MYHIVVTVEANVYMSLHFDTEVEAMAEATKYVDMFKRAKATNWIVGLYNQSFDYEHPLYRTLWTWRD